MIDADRWGALQVRHLRAFAAVVEQGSFSGAARALGYTQSGVSQQIFALEQIIGAPVLTRHPGGRRAPELTATGRLMLEHARALLARVQVTAADLEALAAGTAGALSVATIQSIGARVLPGVLASFRSGWPHVQVRIVESFEMEPLLGSLARGDVDVGFCVLPIGAGPFEVRHLLFDPYIIATRADRRERRLEDLAGKRLLGIRGCFNDQLVERRLTLAGIVPASIERFDDNGMIQELAAAGEGVAVVPRLTIDLADTRLSVNVLDALEPRELVVATHAERRKLPALASLVEIAVDACRRLGSAPVPDAVS